MSITSNASTDETSSPFFLRNEQFCREFERYIESKGGESSGNYNAWNYEVHGIISTPKKWDVSYRKSTYSIRRTAITSSADENVHYYVVWETDLNCPISDEFTIRERSFFYPIRRLFNQNIRRLAISNRYVLELKKDEPYLITKLINLFEALFQAGEVFEISNQNNKLRIDLRTPKHHFELFENLVREFDSF